jgi:hypothetical protein
MHRCESLIASADLAVLTAGRTSTPHPSAGLLVLPSLPRFSAARPRLPQLRAGVGSTTRPPDQLVAGGGRVVEPTEATRSQVGTGPSGRHPSSGCWDSCWGYEPFRRASPGRGRVAPASPYPRSCCGGSSRALACRSGPRRSRFHAKQKRRSASVLRPSTSNTGCDGTQPAAPTQRCVPRAGGLPRGIVRTPQGRSR